jgi:hypothetical protein
VTTHSDDIIEYDGATREEVEIPLIPPDKYYLVSLNFTIKATDPVTALLEVLNKGSENIPTGVSSQELEVISE